jgi:hypothetical protein
MPMEFIVSSLYIFVMKKHTNSSAIEDGLSQLLVLEED